MSYSLVRSGRFWLMAQIRSAVLEPYTSPFHMVKTIIFGITGQQLSAQMVN